MHFRTDRTSLADTASWVARAIAKNPAIAALAGIRINALGDDSLHLSAFDYDAGHAARLEGSVVDEGAALVPAAFLTSVLAGLRTPTVECALVGQTFTVTAGRSTYSAQVLNLADYPELPAPPTSLGEVHAETLAELVAAVEFPIDDDTPHPQIRGLHLEAAGRELTAVGAQAALISEAVADWNGEPFVVSIPRRSLSAAVKGLAGQVSIGITDGLVGLTDGTRSVTLRTFDGDEYVKWRDLIRDESPVMVTLDADELLAAVKQISTVTRTKDGAIAMTIAAGEVEISAASDGESSGSEFLDATTDGDTARFGFNPGFLLGLLGPVASGPVHIGYAGDRKPLIFTPRDGVRQVLMPRRLKEN